MRYHDTRTADERTALEAEIEWYELFDEATEDEITDAYQRYEQVPAHRMNLLGAMEARWIMDASPGYAARAIERRRAKIAAIAS